MVLGVLRRRYQESRLLDVNRRYVRRWEQNVGVGYSITRRTAGFNGRTCLLLSANTFSGQECLGIDAEIRLNLDRYMVIYATE